MSSLAIVEMEGMSFPGVVGMVGRMVDVGVVADVLGMRIAVAEAVGAADSWIVVVQVVGAEGMRTVVVVVVTPAGVADVRKGLRLGQGVGRTLHAEMVVAAVAGILDRTAAAEEDDRTGVAAAVPSETYFVRGDIRNLDGL